MESSSIARILSPDEVEELRKMYPKGTCIKLIEMVDEPYHPVPSGTIGSVKYVDDAGTIHMHWQSGSSLALLPSVDKFQKL